MSCSVLILARNEQKHIKDCIESCRSFADEVIVVDDFSTDDTKKIAEGLGAKVVQRSMNGNWGEQQTFAIEQATSDWIFFIDADERCTPELAAEIQSVKATTEYFAYWVKRINHFNRKRVRFGVLSPDWVVRLMPRKGSYVTGYVHPKLWYEVPEKKARNAMLHFTYDTWAQYESKMNKYSTLAARKYFEEGKKSRYVFDVVCRPLFSFLKMYILKLGFLDGALGFALSVNYTSYTLAKYFKLSELKKASRSSNP